jgi:hypothetical protein
MRPTVSPEASPSLGQYKFVSIRIIFLGALILILLMRIMSGFGGLYYDTGPFSPLGAPEAGINSIEANQLNPPRWRAR